MEALNQFLPILLQYSLMSLILVLHCSGANMDS